MKKGKHAALSALIFVVLLILLNVSILAAAPDSSSAPDEANQDEDINQRIWEDVPVSTVQSKLLDRVIVPDSYRLLTADVTALRQRLGQAPAEGSESSLADDVLLSLPLPDGTYGIFKIEASPIMEPGLAQKYPELLTYRALGVDDPTAYARLSWSPSGFQAIILSGSETVYIDPNSRDSVEYYISYYKKDFGNIWAKEFSEGIIAGEGDMPREDLPSRVSTGPVLRTYRLAMAATGEYTIYHGGTVPQAMAAIVTTMNRVNAIYERELSITMDLIANNDQIIYTNPATDPYTNSNGSAMLSQNQTNLDNVIGSANYDIGHVFSTGGGGIAWLAAVCNNSVKARGVTGSSNPVGDPFDVDYVAHEIGHQFAANHTFNASASGACSGGNRNGPTAYEPGSASTIMGYAGICGSQDLQPHSDDYFHGINYDEIVSFVSSGGGSTCGTTSETNNNAPVVAAGSDYTIPKETPFILSGSATDPNGDAMTYGWEEFDIGAPWSGLGMPNNDSDGNPRPIFRSYLPVTENVRTFPKLASILEGTNFNIGESLPTIDRTMEFRLTVRDNRGGVGNDSMNVIVENAAGPFTVTEPNTAVNWQGATQETVTWDVANTNAAPVSCLNVDILLSDDGGNTFPFLLALDTPNDGSELVSVPNTASSSARVQVKCAGNIFFDIGDQNFTIIPGDGPIEDLAGCSTNTLAANDNGSTSAVGLPFTLNFLGDSYSELFVNNNGNVTFDSALGNFTPFDLSTTDRVIVAPFFADVDTRVGNDVTYGDVTFNGRPAFCVDWIDVGYYAQHQDKLNAFQLILVDRSDIDPGDFDIIMNYGGVQWETGDASGGTDGLGGQSARVGYSNGSTASFELDGSGTNGAFLDSNNSSGLIYNSYNSPLDGRYVYEIRNGSPMLGDINASPSIIDEGDSIVLTGTMTDSDPTTGFELAIDWGDGEMETFNYPAGSTNFSETHTYLDDDPSGTPADDYTIALTLKDDDGNSDSGSAMVTVNNIDPTADAGADKEGFAGFPISFAGSLTDPGVLDTHHVKWDFGDGNMIMGFLTPTHTYADPGVYTVTFTVTDDDTGVGSDTLMVTIEEPKNIFFPIVLNELQ